MPSLRVKVNQGVVRGCEEKLPNGRLCLRFSGIPYAKPPINELRFKSPQKLTKFDVEELDCTKERDGCYHRSTLTRKFVGSEDCLNLNVYVPVSENLNKKFAVMVYIHGGRFRYDSATKDLYSPEYLLMENVIVVTINSRQHIIGYFSLPSKGISGNASLKDQQMALEWIHENIASFNGDPNKICLFGESGGALSTHFHVLNAKSRQLISSAICQSGTSTNEWAFYKSNDEIVIRLAKRLGCQTDSLDDAFNTLMNASAQELYENCEKMTTKQKKSGARTLWRFIIEDESEDAFITESSIESMISQAGKINFPIIYGSNDGDGMPSIAQYISRKNLAKVNQNLGNLIPNSLVAQLGDNKNAFTEEMRRFYFNGRELTEELYPEINILSSDLDYLLTQTITNELTARYQPGCKQFLYEFQFDGKLNIQKSLIKLEHMKGACHADDIFYLFGGVLADKVQLTKDSREWKMRGLMCKLWTNFAKYHDPTPDHDNPLNFKWTSVEPVPEAVKDVTLDYLVINDEPKMVRNLHKGRMDFWRRAYRKYNREYIKAKL